MAISANAVFEVRTGGSDTNGGGFVTGASGTDYSLQNGNRTGADVTNISTTDAVAAGTTTITSVTGNFTSALIGNIVYFQGGTGSITAIRKQVTAVGSATSITIDSSIAASTGMTMNIGGALLSPAIASATATVAGQITYIKSGTYSITTASTNVAAGCISATSGTVFIGYSTNRTPSNTDTRPVLQLSSVSSATIAAGAALYYNLEFDGATQTTSRYSNNSSSLFVNCLFRNFTAANSAAFCVRCYGTGSSAAVFTAAFACEASANTATPFTGHSVNCIAYGNTGGSTNGFSVASSAHCFGCVAYNNGQHGFSATTVGTVINCHAEANASKGYSMAQGYLINCGSYNNTGGRASGGTTDMGAITLTGSAFTNAGGNDFSLNNTAGGGAALRAAGYPATFNASGSADYVDVGALQHQDPATVPLSRVFTGF